MSRGATESAENFGGSKRLSAAFVGGEAVATIDGAARARFEGDNGFLAALGAGRGVAAGTIAATVLLASRPGDSAVVAECLGPGRFRLGIADEVGVAGGATRGAAIETADRNAISPLLIEALFLIGK